MSFGDGQPTFDELMEVVQRQQEVIEIFEQQMEASNREKAKMAEESEKKSEIIRLMETSESLLKEEIDWLRSEKDEIETEMKGRKPEEQRGREDAELETIEELRLKCKELTYEVEKLKTQQTSLEIEIETHKKNNEFIRNELDEERKQRQLEKDRLISSHQLIEQQLRLNIEELQKSLKISQIESANLKTDLEMREHRGKQLERLYQDLVAEIDETRSEKSTVMVRCSTMTTEMAELKAKMQQLRGARNNSDVEDMGKLLADQSHLIAALREETKLLARKIEVDSREYRQSIKSLKQDKRELEQRIETFLRVD